MSIAAEVQSEDKLSETAGYRRARRLRIVSIDDNPLVSFNTSAMLEDLGHTVFAATNGARALEILRSEASIDLLITDQAMPGMTGAELATEIRERPAHRVIIAAGFAGLGKGAGAEFPKLSKPLSRTTSRT